MIALRCWCPSKEPEKISRLMESTAMVFSSLGFLEALTQKLNAKAGWMRLWAKQWFENSFSRLVQVRLLVFGQGFMQPDRKKNVAFVFWRGKRTNKKTKTRGAKKIKKRSVCIFFWIDLKQNFVKQLCESVRHYDVFTSKIEDRNFDLLHFCLFRAACWVFCCCFFALCRDPFVHARLRKTLWNSAPFGLFFVRGQTCNKKISSCQIRCRLCFFCFSVCALWFVWQAAPEENFAKQGHVATIPPCRIEPSFHSWCNFQNGFCKGSWILGHAS